MQRQVYLVVGVPCSGKSWVCEQLQAQYNYVRHDDYKDTNRYLEAIRRNSETATRPLLIETPFSVSQLKEPLEQRGFRVTPVFIVEDEATLRQRYRDRERKDIPAGHLTRQHTYAARAEEWGAFKGSSKLVLEMLQRMEPQLLPARTWPWE